jgi:pimeloyl-ACP methyl ester carboxylesterase
MTAQTTGAAAKRVPKAGEFVFSSTPGMPGLLEPSFDYQAVRAMGAGSYGDGGAVGEVYSTVRRVVDGDVESWTAAWSDTAGRIEHIANACRAGGHMVSAREAFLRASCYWGTGCFYLESKDPRHVEMYKRHRFCFMQAAKLFDPPIEVISIPYENGKTLPGYFMRAAAAGGPRPTLMIIGGGDNTCEELYYWGGGAAAIRRGYNAFLWEGPGQVGAYALDTELTFRPDWEVPTRYAVDYVLSRADVDPKRIALSGHSMGGYFAPRAAAFEKRLGAVIANSLCPEIKPMFAAMLGLHPTEPFGEDLEAKVDLSPPMRKFLFGPNGARDRFGMAGQSLAAYLNQVGAFSLAGLEREISCPLLHIAGEAEGPLMTGLGHECFEKLICPKTERVLRSVDGAEAHCTMNDASLKHQIEFDWLDDVFNLRH